MTGIVANSGGVGASDEMGGFLGWWAFQRRMMDRRRSCNRGEGEGLPRPCGRDVIVQLFGVFAELRGVGAEGPKSGGKGDSADRAAGG